MVDLPQQPSLVVLVHLPPKGPRSTEAPELPSLAAPSNVRSLRSRKSALDPHLCGEKLQLSPQQDTPGGGTPSPHPPFQNKTERTRHLNALSHQLTCAAAATPSHRPTSCLTRLTRRLRGPEQPSCPLRRFGAAAARLWPVFGVESQRCSRKAEATRRCCLCSRQRWRPYQL